MNKLVVAEKPSVGVSIAKVLGATNRKDGYLEGNGYYVTWCVGHLVELATAECYSEAFAKWNYNDLPILPEDWQYNISKGKEKQMKIIGTLMRKADVDEIICATDAGREGELIFRFVYDKLDCIKPIKRLWISSLEDEAIANGFSNLHEGKDFENLYQAALCRAKADWLIGINATRLFSVLYGKTLNIGRVMSPTLAMIVDRNATISTFQSQPFYNVELTYGDLILSSDKFLDKNYAQQVMNQCHGQTITIANVEQKEKVQKPPKLYDLTTLQRDANRILGFTAEQTLQYTQSLYEQKLVTYPRTDSRYLTDDMQHTVPAIANACSSFFMDKSTTFQMNMSIVCDNNKVTDHHAIIPTMKVKGIDLHSIPFGEREILKLIALRLLVAIGDNHVFAETIITTAFGETTFSTKGKTVIIQGFKSIQQLYNTQSEKKEAPLPNVVVNDKFMVAARIKEGKTSPPQNYTDDTLLQAMENANNAEVDADRKGIGTPATRAGIMEKLIKTGLVERQGDKKIKRFIPTHKGIALITVLPEVIQSPLLTAQWEEKLKLIETGKLSSQAFMDGIVTMISDLVKTYEVIKDSDVLFLRESSGDTIGTCPRCGGHVQESAKGYFCDNRACSFAIWKENKFFTAKKKTVTKTLVKELLATGKVSLKGCYSPKTGKHYDCIVFLDDTGGKYVNFKMEFGKK